MRPVQILLIEDSVMDRELTIRALHQVNAANEIHVAKDGEEALDFLFCRGAYAQRSFTVPPTVILLDLHLPKVDGLEVLKAIRADDRTKAIPVVILTSSEEEKDRVEGHRFVVDAFIRKPVESEEFVQIVRQLGMCWERIPPS